MCGCNHYETGYFTAFCRIAEEQFDFVMHTGDYIYEDGARAGRVRQHRGGEIFSIVEYRNAGEQEPRSQRQICNSVVANGIRFRGYRRFRPRYRACDARRDLQFEATGWTAPTRCLA